MFKVAIAGCRNVGKTTIFNLLTGKKNKTGNWEGVTVDICNARMLFHKEIQIFDLPGMLELNVQQNSLDQAVSQKFLHEQQPDLIVNIITTEHLKRDLRLSIELYELGVPMLILVVENSHKIIGNLQLFNCEMMHFNLREKGIIRTIIQKIHSMCKNKENRLISFFHHVQEMQYQDIEQQDELTLMSPEKHRIIQNARNRYVNRLLQDIHMESNSSQNITDKIDKVVMHRFFGIPIFLLIVCSILFLTIFIGNVCKPLFEDATQYLILQPIAHLMSVINISENIINLFKNGIGSGIQTIISFIPLLFVLYILLGIIDETGYMTRASNVMSRLTSKVGLSGKSIIPLIIGFGCNVPAIMGTRIIENRKQRTLTIILIPFMSCGARLTVFALFASTFFPNNGELFVCVLYFFSIFLACAIAFVLQPYLGNHTTTHQISHMSRYKMPNIFRIFHHTIEKIKDFITSTGGIIIALSFILYLLAFTPSQKHDSLLIDWSKKLEFVFEPIGVTKDNWPATVSLMTGVVAKEVIVSTLLTLYGMENENDTQNLLRRNFQNDINAFSYILFVLLYFPCISVFGVMKKEAGIKIATISGIFYTLLAYIIAYSFRVIAMNMNNSIAFSLLLLTLGITGISVILRAAIIKFKLP